MTALPDPGELAPTRDPAAYGRRPLLSRGFWAMIGFCALCLIAAAAVVTLWPRFAGHRPSNPAIARSALPATAFTSLGAAPAPTTTPVSPDVAALGERVQRLETGQARVVNAAAGALAAAALSDAASRPRPFAGDLAAFARLAPASPDALALAPLAQQGAPTRAALAAELADIAAKVSVAAHAPDKHASFMAQLAYALSRVVSVRRIDATGRGPDAVLAQAERRAGDGDLEGAVAVLDTLPPSARAGVAPWRDKAVRRIEIDGHIAGLRAQAAADLAALRSAG